jgi:hypothetical protein
MPVYWHAPATQLTASHSFPKRQVLASSPQQSWHEPEQQMRLPAHSSSSVQAVQVFARHTGVGLAQAP